ncbi:hypothetical protein [Klebsiella phage 05F01]|nr:hypothetical protein [Klebsiella phage 05F01]
MGQQLVEIDYAGIDSAYASGVVKPNEYRQIVSNIVEKEVLLRKESLSTIQKYKMFFSVLVGKNFFEEFYTKQTSENSLTEAIITIASNEPEKLLIDEEESKYLFLSDVFYKKAVLVRDCSDVHKSEYNINKSKMFVDKPTLRAIEYLNKYAASGRMLINLFEGGKV